MSEILFYAVPAFVGRIDSASIVHFWCAKEPPTPDPARLVEIDLSRSLTPTNWAAELDAHRIDGGLTGLGPDLPGGHLQAPVYCIKSKWDECVSKGSWILPPGDEDYQYQCLARSAAGPSIERFHGFRAEVVRAAGRIVLLDLYKANDPGTPQRRMWVDLDDGASCLPKGAYTTIEPNSLGSNAIFLSSKLIQDFGLFIPKLPRGYHGETWPGQVRVHLLASAAEASADHAPAQGKVA